MIHINLFSQWLPAALSSQYEPPDLISTPYSVWKQRGRGPVVCIVLVMAALAIQKTYLVPCWCEWIVGSDSILEALWLSPTFDCEKVTELEL